MSTRTTVVETSTESGNERSSLKEPSRNLKVDQIAATVTKTAKTKAAMIIPARMVGSSFSKGRSNWFALFFVVN